MNLQDIYQEILLAHNESPNNFSAMPDATHFAKGHNPLCGDEITVYLKLNGNRIEAISFLGEGCAICKASGSMMTVALNQLEDQEAFQKVKAFIALLSDNQLPVPENLGELEALLGVRKFPARLKCATLAWHAFLKALHGPRENRKPGCCSTHSCCKNACRH